MSDLLLLQLIVLTFIYCRLIFTQSNGKCDFALWIHETVKSVSSPSSTEPCTLSCLCHCDLHIRLFSRQHLFAPAFHSAKTCYRSSLNLSFLSTQTSSTHPCRKVRSQMSPVTEKMPETQGTVSQHALTPFPFPILKSTSISLSYRRCLKT